MRGRVMWVVMLLIALGWGTPARPADEEFLGPFPSWKNVKRDYGAVGDGKADDTAAIQRALDELTTHKEACVLYFPAGTYRLTDTVKTLRKAHTDGMGISVVGEDPARTILRWEGAPGGTMVRYDAWYSRISRLTLDGGGKAGIALAYGPAFSTYNETSDMVFQNAAVGMQMATEEAGQAENMVKRCRFLRCSQAGLMTVNFNSMDIWAWFCRFEDCGTAMYNRAGNFHAYHNLFLRSRKADIGTENLMVFSFVGNTSVGSGCFLDFGTGHTWGSPCSITGNRILDPTGDRAIRLGNGGPYLVMDNVIRGRAGVSQPLVEKTWGDQAFVGNTYTTRNAVKEAGRFRRLDEKVVDRKTISSALPSLPPTPASRGRRVFEVPAGADAAAIQAALDSAARLKGRRPVVHLPMGVYRIDRTLSIPAGSDLQLVGDAGAETGTILRWSGSEGGTVLRLAGPSRATVRDLLIDAGRGRGILVEGCDQPGGLVFGEQLNLQGKSEAEAPRAGLLVEGVERSDVMLLCQQGGTCRNWIEVAGGASGPASAGARGQVAVYTGATGTSEAQYLVRWGGRLVVRSVYHEVSGASPQGVLLEDSGTLSIDATRFSYRTSAERPLVRINGFRGRFTLLTELLLPVDSTTPARVETTGDGRQTEVLCLGNLFWQNGPAVSADEVWRNAAQPPARAAMLLCNQNLAHGGAEARGFAVLEDRGRADDAFLRRMLEPLRSARLRLPGSARAGATDLSLYRVICSAGRDGVGLELRAAGAR